MDIQLNFQTIILSILAIAVLYLLWDHFTKSSQYEIEEFKSSTLNSEALQNIASVYNKGDLSVTKLNATSSAKITNANIPTLTSSNITTQNLNVTRLNILPRGIIVAWSGTSAPAGWTLCNGQNGTPNLRGRFIMGVGGGRASRVGVIGGAETVRLSVSHLPSHNHPITPTGDDHGYCSTRNSRVCGLQSSDRSSNDRRDSRIRTNNAGGNQPHENLPPFYALAYIMKL